MDAKLNCKKKIIQPLRDKGSKGGRVGYKHLRGEEISDNEKVEDLKVNE